MQAQQLPGHEDILPPGEVGVETHAQFQQRGHAAFGVYAAAGGLCGAGDDFEQGAFAGTVDANDADGLAGVDGEVDVAQHPSFVVPGFAGEPFQHPRPFAGIAFVGLAYVGNNELSHQSSSTSSPTRDRKNRAPNSKKNTVSTVSGTKLAKSGRRWFKKMVW